MMTRRGNQAPTAGGYPLPLPFMTTAKIIVACVVMAIGVKALNLPDEMMDLMQILVMSATGAIIYTILCAVLNIANCRQTAITFYNRLRNKRAQGDNELEVTE